MAISINSPFFEKRFCIILLLCLASAVSGRTYHGLLSQLYNQAVASNRPLVLILDKAGLEQGKADISWNYAGHEQEEVDNSRNTHKASHIKTHKPNSSSSEVLPLAEVLLKLGQDSKNTHAKNGHRKPQLRDGSKKSSQMNLPQQRAQVLQKLVALRNRISCDARDECQRKCPIKSKIKIKCEVKCTIKYSCVDEQKNDDCGDDCEPKDDCGDDCESEDDCGKDSCKPNPSTHGPPGDDDDECC